MNDFQNINGYENLLYELNDHATLRDSQTLFDFININIGDTSYLM